MESWNPALSSKTFEKAGTAEDRMTFAGTVKKTAILLALTVISAAFAWKSYFAGDEVAVEGYLAIGIIGGFVVSLITIFRPKFSPLTAPIYAVLEGLFLGAFTATVESALPGTGMLAAGLTFGTMACMLFAYASGLIKATEKFKLAVVSMTGAICLIYIAGAVLKFFGMPVVFMHDAGPFGIVTSLIVIVTAALNLVMDFDFIAQGIEKKSPKYMEWYFAFSLLLTLIWLYLEILHLLLKLSKIAEILR